MSEISSAAPPALNLSPAEEAGIDLSAYFGLWCVEPERFARTFQAVTEMGLAAHIANAATRTVKTSATRADELALVDIQGTLMKSGTSLSSAQSLIELRRQVRLAADDPDIGGILLRIDSPGGTVAGTADLAAEVRAANAKKPVFAFVEDLAASAAYWVASQARQVFANDATAMVGSIGTFIGLVDSSAAAEAEGVRPVVVKSGRFKAAGFPGTPIEQEFIDEVQQLVDKVQAEFSAAVRKGRGMSAREVDAIADGRVHVATDAQAAGLIDGIKTFDKTVAALRAEVRRNAKATTTSKGVSTMDHIATTTAPSATLEELRLFCPRAEDKWTLNRIEQGATLDQARSDYVDLLHARMDALEDEAAVARAERDQLAEDFTAYKNKPGVTSPVGETAIDAEAATSATDPVTAWRARVAELVHEGKTRPQAIRHIATQETALNEAFIEATDTAQQPKRRRRS